MSAAAILIICACVLLFCFLAYGEVKRSNKKRLLQRIIFTAFAIGSLTCIAFELHVKTHVAIQKINEAILLTENYNKDSLNVFTATKKNIPVYTIANIDTIAAKNFAAVHVFGEGLNDQQLQQLKDATLIFHPAVIDGIVTVNWQQHISSGKQLQVQGKYYNNRSTAVKLVLNGLQTNLDTVIIPANNIFQFNLSCLPKHKGEAVYQLYALEKNDTLEKNPLPVEVANANPVKVVLLSSSPDFENKFLKNWLTSHGYAVADYAATSKNKNTESFTNIKSVSLNNFTTSSLDSFDVVITDASFITSANKQQQDVMQTQLQKGLGFIIRADSAGNTSAFMHNIKAGAAQRRQQTIKFYLNNINKDSFALPEEQISFLKNINDAQPLITDATGNVVAASTISGKGTIIITSLANTLQLVLSGKTNEYNRLWSFLLQQAAKTKQMPETIALPAFARINQPAEISLQLADNNFMVTVDASNTYLKQNMLLPFIKQGTYWPTNAGWHTIKGSQQFNWYVFDATDYKNVAAYEKIIATKQFIKKQQVQPKKNMAYTFADTPISKIWFVIIFILSCSYLWIERKLVTKM